MLVKVSFRLKIGDLMDSNIMQLLPLDFAKSLVNELMNPIPAPQEMTEMSQNDAVQTAATRTNTTSSSTRYEDNQQHGIQCRIECTNPHQSHKHRSDSMLIQNNQLINLQATAFWFIVSTGNRPNVQPACFQILNQSTSTD